jgi:GT2 family glycosyltransferase
LSFSKEGGTTARVAAEFPEVTVLHGNGKLYWNGGMRRAFAAAIAGDYDYYLWVNDDTHLDDGALGLLLDTERRLRAYGEEAVIVAGSTRHPETGELTYGGVVQPYRWRPLKSVLVEPGDTPRPCHTMNGNATRISRAVVRRVGNIDPAFVQRMRDFDYGLRARAAGCSVWIAPGTVGTCASHPKRRPGEQPLGDELRRLWSIKELSPGPWAVYSRRWAARDVP